MDYFDEEVQEAGEGIEMVDRHLRYLRESGSVDALAARIVEPEDEGAPASPEWTPEDTGHLTRIVARMNGRKVHRDEIRKFKAVAEAYRVAVLGTKPSTDHAVVGETKTDRVEIEKDQHEREHMLAAFTDWLNGLRNEVPEIVNLVETSSLGTDRDAKDNAIRRWYHSDRGIHGATAFVLDLYACSVNPRAVQERIRDIEELPVRVKHAQNRHRRLTNLVAKMESRNFTAAELNKLAAAMARRPQPELNFVTAKKRLPVRPSDVGVGISQLLPVVVAVLDPVRPGITAIEQPELHVHPRIQVVLGDLFAQQINQGGIFLIETHSEHLLLRIMRRMRQTGDGTLPDGEPEVRPEDIVVLFVEIDPDGEQTLIREMPLNERGELVKAWPGGFFEEDLHEIF